MMNLISDSFTRQTFILNKKNSNSRDHSSLLCGRAAFILVGPEGKNGVPTLQAWPLRNLNPPAPKVPRRGSLAGMVQLGRGPFSNRAKQGAKKCAGLW